jgi:UDP-N-acetylmuramoyl-tripeptide--D-alanyl-D-alanine ligase
MSIPELYQIYLQHPEVTTDSRRCQPGSLFFALRGETFDGNRFAAKALQDGCAYAVIDDPAVQTDERMIRTDNVLETLQQLASHHRRAMGGGIPIIGVTGTNGKTTTKELLAAVLSARYRLHYTSGNLNNHIGVPLTLLGLRREHEMAIVEMGANHPGEIRELTQMVRPNYGLITNVGYGHLEGFGSLEGVIRTKGELYDFLRSNGGRVFIRQEDACLQRLAQGLEQITYGESDGAAYVRGKVVDCRPFLRLQWRERGESHTIDTHLAGDYNLWNVLAAIAAGCYFGVPAEQIDRAIAAYRPSNNRSQWQETAHNHLIIDAYNANPSSMKAALTNFAAWPVSPKAAILGDMGELGESSPALHADVVQLLHTCAFDRVLLCGAHFSAATHPYPSFPDTDALAAYLTHQPLRGYHILLKGSHRMHLEQLIELL